MIRVIENQTLFDIAIQEQGNVLCVFDLSIANDKSVTEFLYPGQQLKNVVAKEYESFDFKQVVEKYIDKRSDIITAIEAQSILDIAIENDGCVLASVDWALNNRVSITDLITPGQKFKMPKSSELRYEDLANYFKSNNTKIATFNKVIISIPTEYEFPMEFPLSF